MQGPQPGLQLGQVEGLGQIVVGAGIQALHPIVRIAAGCQHQHRHVVAPLAQPLQDLESRQPRQGQVEDDDVERVLLQGRVGQQAVATGLDLDAQHAERLGQSLYQLQVVFDQQDAHG